MKDSVKPINVNKSNNETVCAVVVTYNRKKLLLECLSALKEQTRHLDAIYIIDNASTDGTQDILLENGYINQIQQNNLDEPCEIKWKIVSKTKKNNNKDDFITIHYVKMHKNFGGAGGFYEGFKRSYEKKYDWLWVMDDDGLPEPNTLEQLLKSAKNNNLSVIGPVILCKDNTNNIFSPYNKMTRDDFFKKYKDSIIYDVLPVFNGSLYHRSVIKKVGYPDKSLFIWGDEDDYRNRLRCISRIGVTTEALYYHPQLFTFKTGTLLGRKFKYSLNPTWKIYYQLRNHTYLSIYKKQKYNILKQLIKELIIDLKYRKENRWSSVFYHFKAIFDGATKRLGKRISFMK